MQNCCSSDFSEELAAWAHCQAPAYDDGISFQVPGWLGTDESNAYSSVLPSWPETFEEDRAVSASKSHSQAEKRRRDRINAQLATLRKLIPKSDKMDKAALLGSVVEHVKELKRRTLEVSKIMSIPTDIDEVTIFDCNVDEQQSSTTGNIVIGVSICCDDRPELFSELNQAMEGLRLRIVEADMSSVGGRIKANFVVCSKDSVDDENGMNTLKETIKVVLSKIVVSNMSSTYRIKSKRQRFFFPSHYSQ